MPRILRVIGPAALLVAAVAAMIAALAFGGGANAPLLADPGALVRWGLPAATLVVNLSLAGTVGALVLACFAFSPDRDEYGNALDFAAGSAAVMTVASAATGLFTFVSVSNVPWSFDATFSNGLSSFITSVSLGQAWLGITLIAAAVTVLCFAVRNQTAIVFVTLLAMATVVPMAQQGHSAEAAGHDAAVTSFGLHVLFAAIWLGGLVTLIVVKQRLGNGRLVTVLERYSTVALICFVVVAASGYVNAELRVGTLAELATPYGILVLVKVAALVVLGLFGLTQRRYLIGRLKQSGEPRSFWWIVVAELAFMGIASGVAAALARTVTPVPETRAATPTPAEILTGEKLPPALTWDRLFTSWNFDLLWVLACAFGLFLYFAGVWRLRKRGDAWPIYRTVLWTLGIVLLFYITNGGVNVYEKYLFSAHMSAHMVLTMGVPLLLVPGAPITLAARAIRKRRDGSRGGREWLLLAVHSRFAGVISNPIVAAILFAGSLWVFYYTPVFRWATTDHIGHEWMIVHFLITGYLFVQSLIGIDPVKYRLPYPFRLLLLLLTMAFHAFFGLSIMQMHGLLLADWFGAMGRTWGDSPLVDQQAGGGIAWSIGEIPTVILAIVVAIQWSRSDERETKRRDRNADRTGEAELRAYNERLARMADRDRVSR
ncbi:putative copper resistance protein D [Leifsonia sp. 98AMF]|nr:MULTISPECIES: cytochrome c oxidase assembly protein [unclassified Leifsonia]SDG97477.1 putative copper resistance protein D [Leifsonia sp. 197AMF]SDJ44024.1 putative copper resistance protein D [Leifsonia sp. 466MF]SDK32389.1 putative copper resistance protein D [Leifsonia sp. 157MF]SDN64369.1 putative copper resistance protein D [Leifsonia sp. 509MF]SEN44442.1 putative copper resistance protein D [Leifsonia sp. 467MF]